MLNTDDKRVEWKLGGLPGDFNSPGFRRYGGVVTTDGAWTPVMVVHVSFATSPRWLATTRRR